MNKHFVSLEYDKILEQLSQEASFEDSKNACLGVMPRYNKEDVETLLNETDNAFVLMGKFGAPSLSSLKNPTSPLKVAQAGGMISPKDLLNIAEILRVIRGVKQWQGKADNTQFLNKYIDFLYPNKFLEEAITNAIIAEDEISDRASTALFDIRRKIRTASSKARETLDKIIHSSTMQKFLQEAIVTQRDGRFVVPVKAECRANVPGLVHDTSRGGQTVFIEPMGVVQANNDIRVLKSKEEKEIERIIYELSAMAGESADSILCSYDNLVSLDVVFAKASLAYNMKASKPYINDEKIIDLKKARHPLINKDKVVPVDINLGDGFDTLIITGPNTGGKTVSLKTLGLLTLMAMAGFMIPAGDNSKISVFKKVFSDIGDEQSIEQSLSTFSSHMINIVEILKVASRNSLVLIDELGAGTDPVEGAALAVAILEKLRYKKASIACTTHYAELKEFALQTEGVENGSCEFDITTLCPTYRLLIGIPGKSNAFAISTRLGLQEDIINRSKKLVSSENKKFEETIASIEETRQEMEHKLDEAQNATIEAQQIRLKAEKEIESLKREAQAEIRKAREEAARITSRTKAQAESIMDEIADLQKKKSLSSDKKAQLKKSIDTLEKVSDPIEKSKQERYEPPRPYKKGDSVLIYDIDKKGTIIEINGDTAYVQAGIIKTKVHLSNLRLQKEKPKVQSPKTFRRQSTLGRDMKATTEIDVRGESADEAIIDVDRALDTAVLQNLNMITIIHGKGTGVLRKEIQKFLKNHPAIKSYRNGTYGEGDMGVTIAELK